MFADAPDIAIHRKAQGVGVDTAVVGAVKTGLEHHAGVGNEELHHKAFGDQAFVIEVVHQGVVPKSCPPLVHHLGLPLWVKVLGDLAHDAHHFTLPGLQQGRVFFQEVQNVFLRLFGEAGVVLLAEFVCAFGDGAPQIVDLFLQVLLAFLLSTALLFG